MTLVQLRYFLAALQAGSISRAATQVRVAQPALSQQLGLLEAEFGQPLLRRHARGVTPTEAGRRLGERAIEILRQVDLTRDELAVDAASPVGTVALGMATAFNMAFSVEVMLQTKRRFPPHSAAPGRKHERLSARMDGTRPHRPVAAARDGVPARTFIPRCWAWRICS